jgi:hypothetical protein
MPRCGPCPKWHTARRQRAAGFSSILQKESREGWNNRRAPVFILSFEQWNL